MSSQIIPFKHESHEIRVVADDQGEPWFAAVDVCAVLGYLNPRMSVERHCRQKGVTKRDTLTEGGIQSLTYINEGNLYRLIIKSRKPEAERFESWVCDEVLPTIRKTGSYQSTQSKLDAAISHQDIIKHAVAEHLGRLRVLVSMDRNLVTNMTLVDPGSLVFAPEELPALIEGGAHMSATLMPKIIEAAAKRLQK